MAYFQIKMGSNDDTSEVKQLFINDNHLFELFIKSILK